MGRFYAPQSWPKRAPDPKPTVYGVLNGEFVPLDENGYFIDRTPYVPVTVAAARSAAGSVVSGVASSGGGFDGWGALETAAGAMLGGDGDSGNDDNDSSDGGDEFNLGDNYGGSTAFGDAQPFEYTPDALGDGVVDLAANDRGSMYACDIISSECKGSVLREFPGQYLNSTLNEIQGDAQDGVKDARKALKLLNDGRFKK